MSMAFAKNKTNFIICRLFLGAAESGATPGALMLITLWYPRKMVTSRISMFYSSFAIGAVISGPIASGIMKITNPRFRSWEWIFLIEGLTTCIEEDQAEGGHRAINRKRLWSHVRDPLIYT
ncbi:hypothetical protein IW147_002918 [Coemansia sp. RSA 720]|nr:hypothetical protein IW147_002918 [Coemansia sp. RSA 720]